VQEDRHGRPLGCHRRLEPQRAPAGSQKTAKAINKLAATPVVTLEGTVSGQELSSGSPRGRRDQRARQVHLQPRQARGDLYLRKALQKKLCDATGPNHWFFPAVCVALDATEPSIPLGAMGSYLSAAPGAIYRPSPTGCWPTSSTSSREVRLRRTRRSSVRASDSPTTRRSPRGERPSMSRARFIRSRSTTSLVGHDTDVLKATKLASELVDSVVAQDGWRDLTSAKDVARAVLRARRLVSPCATPMQRMGAP